MSRRFRSARSAEEEQTLLERATPPSTRYATKWALKIFYSSWRAARKVKEVKIEDLVMKLMILDE
jgi:hypothetical protein